MSQFELYFGLGLDHILDVNGYDHILFVIALACLYSIQEWRRVLILVTAFTLGHSITLALATLKFVVVDTELVEFLIPVTIVITAISNLFNSSSGTKSSKLLNAVYAGVFGLIHGLGFSNYLRSLLGGEESIVTPLFAFNVGLEVGQIIIVLIFLGVAFIFVGPLKVPRRYWKIIISVIVAVVGLKLAFDAIYW
ncbi:MAG: HupE/UreJ family protein [Bacteroidota bacterium]